MSLFALRCPGVSLLLLALTAVGWAGLTVGAASEPVPNSETVKMAPVEVNSDPFRTMGMHGSIVSGFGGTHMWINAVNPGSPAAKAGLRADDEIVEFQGRRITLTGVIFSFRKVVNEALNKGESFDCVVRSYHEKDTHVLHLRAMAEPKRQWLPLAQSPLSYPDLKNSLPQPKGEFISDASWQDRGGSTPQAALESLFRAMGRGDIDRVEGMLNVEGSNRAALLSLYQSLPDDGRAYYGTPERMLAAFVDQEARPRWVKIIKISSPDPDSAEIQVTLKFWSDFDHRGLPATYAFHRTAAGWKWAISRHSIRSYADYYRGTPFEVAPPEAVPAIAWFFHSS
jgi:hypothetical protein